MRARMLLAMIIAPTIASIVYTTLVFAGNPDIQGGAAGAERWELMLPAMLVGLLFEVFVLLPLWHLLQPIRKHARLLFLSSGSAAWLLCTTALLVLVKLRGADLLLETADVLIPGLLLVLVFDLLAGRSKQPSANAITNT